jgi:hypothetical protein
MSEHTSRIILGLETLVICLPLTLLYLAVGLPYGFYFFTNFQVSDAHILAAGSITVILAALLCVWVLISAFVLRGSAVLRNLSGFWWPLPILSVALAVAVTMHLRFAAVIEASEINTFGWGVPFLVPLAHLCIERWGRRHANPPGASPTPS